MSTTWIMVCNASQAKLFANVGPNKEIQFVKALTHPESREKTSDLVSDRSGSNAGTGHGSFLQATDPKHHEAENFAQEVSRELDHGLHAYDRLILVASAPFMGLVNGRLSALVRSKMAETFEKDYTHLPVEELVARLEGAVRL